MVGRLENECSELKGERMKLNRKVRELGRVLPGIERDVAKVKLAAQSSEENCKERGDLLGDKKRQFAHLEKIHAKCLSHTEVVNEEFTSLSKDLDDLKLHNTRMIHNHKKLKEQISSLEESIKKYNQNVKEFSSSIDQKMETKMT